jgi:1,4-dihydroxy-2-naphthoate octaprenyltransferase
MASLRTWIIAARMRILPASAVPTLLGIVLAATRGHIDIGIAGLTVLCAMLLQTTSNLLNDLYDFRHGADKKRIGPPRAVASGAIPEKSMRNVSWMMFIITFALGMILVERGGWPIFLTGIASLWAAWAYTGGPWPLAYHGLGELCAFVFYGILPVWGAYYLQIPGESLSPLALIVGTCMGIFAAKILLVNNIRDIPTDPPAGKITLAVRLGDRASRLFYAFLMLAAYACLPLIAWLLHSYYPLLPFILAPFLAIPLTRGVLNAPGAQLTPLLIRTAIHLSAFGILLIIALLLSMLPLSQ